MFVLQPVDQGDHLTGRCVDETDVRIADPARRQRRDDDGFVFAIGRAFHGVLMRLAVLKRAVPDAVEFITAEEILIPRMQPDNRATLRADKVVHRDADCIAQPATLPVQIDVLSWLTGVSVDEAMMQRDKGCRANLFHEIDRQMARLHDITDVWERPAGFTRPAWDRDGLLGEAPLWGRFWDNSHLAPDDRRLFMKMREAANAHLSQIQGDLDYGLIHADLVSVNIMVDAGKVQMIDFDDGGFGFRPFEIATSLLKYMGEADYPSLKASLIRGYTATRTLDLAALDLFILLRATTYVGWNIARMVEDGAKVRNKQYIDTARKLTLDYLAR